MGAQSSTMPPTRAGGSVTASGTKIAPTQRHASAATRKSTEFSREVQADPIARCNTQPVQPSGQRRDGIAQLIRRFVVDHAIATAWTALTDLNGGVIAQGRIVLAHPPPTYARRYVDLLGTEPEFDGPGTFIELENSFLDRPRPATDPVALQVCEKECRALLARREAEGGTRGLVYDRLSRSNGVVPSMTMVASDLNMSERTARRHLEAEGTSFREIEQQVRRERAEALLAEPGLTLTEVATSLGYWSESGFVRAFRRWHDTTPGRWRSAEHVA